MQRAMMVSELTSLGRNQFVSIQRRNLPLDKYIPIMPCVFLSIPEGVSVMTVIIDGVDVAPAGLVKRPPDSQELTVGPVDTTVHCALNG